MRKFIIKAFIFLSLGLIISPIGYLAKGWLVNTGISPNSRDIFIWGDSQMHRGLNGMKLSKLQDLRVLNASRDGAGVYDFYVFAESIPEGSTVLVALSKTIFMRGPSKDRSMAGFSLSALNVLWESQYSPMLLLRILAKNANPDQLFEFKNNLYPYSDTLNIKMPLVWFKEVYSDKPSYFDAKLSIYLKSLEMLKQKSCKVYLIDFPYHPVLDNIQNESPLIESIESVNQLSAEAVGAVSDTLVLTSERQIMYDYTHFNGEAADNFTLLLADFLSENRNSSLLVVKANRRNLKSEKIN